MLSTILLTVSLVSGTGLMVEGYRWAMEPVTALVASLDTLTEAEASALLEEGVTP